MLYYTTDLYEFKVRTEYPDVRIELRRCYYKFWEVRIANEDMSGTCKSFIMHIHTLDIIKKPNIEGGLSFYSISGAACFAHSNAPNFCMTK